MSAKYTRFEKARIIGARALQISMGAPVLVDYPKELIDPINIAIIILGPISAGISSWNKAKNKEAEKEKKEL